MNTANVTLKDTHRSLASKRVLSESRLQELLARDPNDPFLQSGKTLWGTFNSSDAETSKHTHYAAWQYVSDKKMRKEYDESVKK